MLKKTWAPLGAGLVSAVTALDLLPTTTTTIPYFGTSTTSTTLTPCSSDVLAVVTVVVQIPIVVPVCSATPTSTSSTPTPTPSGPCVLVDPFCAPAGLDIDYYSNPLGGYSSGSPPSSYYITQGLRPLDASVTNVTFFPQDYGPPAGTPAVYPNPALPGAPYYVGYRRATNGGITVDANNFTLVYEGFYRARATGPHALCATADNEADVFFGHGDAFSCLDGRASAAAAAPLLAATGGFYVNGLVCKNVDLVSGLYYPVRAVMGNWQGPSAFNLTIQEPGVALENRTNDFSGRVYPRRCGIFV